MAIPQPRAAIEAVALGRDPAERGLTERLNNRAELWSRDGRPDDPLVGLCLVAAQRWVAGAGRTRVSAETRNLVEHSKQLAGERVKTLLLSTRHCASCRAARHVGHLSVCGHCHRLYCAACTEVTRLDQWCVCGGNLAHPPSGRAADVR